MPYDVDGMFNGGASEDQVLGYLRAEVPNFDADGALNGGASKRQVINYMATLGGSQPKLSPQDQANALLSSRGLSVGPPPRPPLPAQLASPNAVYQIPQGTPRRPTVTDPTTGRPVSLIDAESRPGPQRMTEGVEQIVGSGVRTPSEQKAQAAGDTSVPSTGRRVFGGINKAVGGAMQAAAPVALPAAAAIAGPAATGIGLITGTAAQQGVERGLRAAGVPPEYSETAGTAVGLGTGIATGPKIAEALPDSLITPRNPKTAMTQALKPTSTNIGFTGALDRALPEIKASEPAVGGAIADAPKGQALNRMMAAIKDAKKRVWSQYQQMAGPAADQPVDMTPVADAMVQSIPQKFAFENPDAAKAISQTADLYRRTMPLQQVETYLEQTNAELRSFYAKYPPDQRAALTADPGVAAKEAQASAMRDIIANYLDQPGGGAAVREIKQRYGALMNVEREGFRRMNVAARQQPDSLSEQFAKWYGYTEMARGALSLNPATFLAGLAPKVIAKMIKESQTTDGLIRSAFRNYQTLPTPINMPPQQGSRARTVRSPGIRMP